MNYKRIKREARKNIKHNYFKNIIVTFICTILMSGGIALSSKRIININFKKIDEINILNNQYKSNSEIIDEFIVNLKENKEEKRITKRVTNSITSIIINEVTNKETFIFNFLNSINKFLGGYISVGIVIIISNIFLFFFRIVFASSFEVGKNRYFLENRRYLKTNIDRCLYPYKKRKTFHIAKILFIKNLYLFLWMFTIVGYFIKRYEYSMIPYILAENPNVSMKDAFILSKKLTNKNKFNLFKIDLSLLVYKIIGLFTFNLTNIFYTDIYISTLYSEIYMNLKVSKNNIKELDLLEDELLNIKEIKDEAYPYKIKKFSIFNIDYNRDYSINTYILFFFSFSFIGWLWEVFLNIIQNGYFANRGTLYGPWIQIYGFGGIGILLLLKRFRNNPYKLFLTAFLLCGVLEYFAGWYLETIYHLKYWDYSKYYLNLHGRICFEGLLFFGIAGCFFTYVLAPVFDNLFKKLRDHTRNVLAFILIVLFSIDMIYSTFISQNKGRGITTEIEMVEE